MGRRLAVTGANGFVGRHIVKRAAERGFETLGLVRSEAGARVVAEAGGQAVVCGDLRRTLEGCDAVVHLAQIGAERGGETFESVNVRGTERLAAAARDAEVPRVVLFSGLGVAHYGLSPRCTNPYFLSKLAAEVSLFRSVRSPVVFRPSYIVGPGSGFVAHMLRDMAAGRVEQVGDGSYRLHPIAVDDAAACVLAVVAGAPREEPTVFDLVGPQPVSLSGFRDRLAAAARAVGRPARFEVRIVPVAEADALARGPGYRGMGRDELDCLLCDEVSDGALLERLLGRPLTPLDDALRAALPAA